MPDSPCAPAARTLVGENDAARVERNPDGSIHVTVKWALVRVIGGVGFALGLIVGVTLGALMAHG